MKALSLNHATFYSGDLEGQVAYYEEVIGLHVVERSGGNVYLASRSGTDAVVLASGDRTALTGLALQLGSEHGAGDALKELQRHGIAADLRSDPHPAVSRSVAFTDPNGFLVELLFEPRLHPPGPTRGAAPLRLGHVAIVVRNVQDTCRFYEGVLDFRVGDWIGDHFVFMRCGHEHHTLNFVQSDHARLQHLAFEMQDSAALIHACDVLAHNALEIMWGPVRHGPGHNMATYHKNPQGQIIELYTEMDLMTNEALGYYDPRPWHADRPQRPKTWPRGGNIWGPVGPVDFLKQGV